MNKLIQTKPDLSHSHRKLAGRYYYAVGIILFLLGIALMVIPHALHQEGELWKIFSEIGTFLALIVSLHFIYEIFVKKEERRLLIDDLDTLLKQHQKEINSTFQLSRATIYRGQEETYAATVDAIVRTSLNQLGEKSIALAALHGHSGKRRTMRQDSASVFESFADQMYKCIKSSGIGMWYVRELYNITDEGRLKMVLERIGKAENAEGYEVRAFCLQNALPQLSPLIIGDKDLFIAWDDPTYYAPKGSIHIAGRDFVASATEYFESLWNDKRIFVLRSGVGIEAEQINSLRIAIEALTSNIGQPTVTRSRGKNTKIETDTATK